MGYALATVVVAAAISAATSAAPAQHGDGANGSGTHGPVFAEPVRLQADDKFMGEGRLYPSPVFHDVDGDGRLDIVIGDLRGLMTVALRLPGDGPARFGAEQPLLGADGKDLKFHNW